MDLKDGIQAGSWVVASVGGVVAAFKAVIEMRLNRRQQERELRWKQALTWEEMVSKMRSDQPVASAMSMLEWSGREYEIAPGRRAMVTFDQVTRALRTIDLTFEEHEFFVRNCFDHFFDSLGQIQRYLEIDLISLQDVTLVLEYQIATLARNRQIIQGYLDNYGFGSAQRFLDGFAAWDGVSKGLSASPNLSAKAHLT
jgi:hypothetical protein